MEILVAYLGPRWRFNCGDGDKGLTNECLGQQVRLTTPLVARLKAGSRADSAIFHTLNSVRMSSFVFKSVCSH